MAPNVPQKARQRVGRDVAASGADLQGIRALGVEAGSVSRRVQVSRGVVVDIRDQIMHVENAKLGAGPPFREVLLQRHAVLEHQIDKSHVLEHLLLVLGRVVGLLVGPARDVAGAAVLERRIQRSVVERPFGEEHELAPARAVDVVERRPHALDEVVKRLVLGLRVRQERVDAQVVGADPERVHGVVRRPVRVERVGTRVGIYPCHVRQVRGHFVLFYGRQHIREKVGADRAGYYVVARD